VGLDEHIRLSWEDRLCLFSSKSKHHMHLVRFHFPEAENSIFVNFV